MGLFDSVAGQLLGAVTQGAGEGAGPAGLAQAIGGLLDHPEVGGLPGLVKTFEGQGLGGLIQSWIGTGANLPVSAEQIQSVLASGPLQGIVQQLGLSPDTLAQLLPQVIDHLTPDGQLPEGGSGGGLDLSALGGLLGSLGGRG
ncbi:YidB family protein [Leptothrix sp. BB-4]